MKKGILIFVLMLLASCGGAPQSNENCPGECGLLSVIVKGSKSFNPNIDHGRITAYRVTVTGSGIAEPIVAEFSGDAESGMISGIPAGAERQIAVEAVNANSLVIRQGEEGGVSVQGGEISQIEVTLQSVPIFTNIANGNIIDNTRLIFHIFSEPSGPVVVEDVSESTAMVLADAATAAMEVSLDQSTGLGTFVPAVQAVGGHKYRVRNAVTGRQTAVSVNLNDGTKRRAAPFFAGGDGANPFRRSRLSSGTH